jgi:hypothetical protein
LKAKRLLGPRHIFLFIAASSSLPAAEKLLKYACLSPDKKRVKYFILCKVILWVSHSCRFVDKESFFAIAFFAGSFEEN